MVAGRMDAEFWSARVKHQQLAEAAHAYTGVMLRPLVPTAGYVKLSFDVDS